VVAVCITMFNKQKFMLSPHSIFMSFVWISEQTVIISLCSINWLASQKCKTRLLSSLCVWVCPPFRMEQLGCLWTDFHETWCVNIYRFSPPPIFRKSVGKNQVSFKFDKNNWYFTWRHSHLWYCLAEFYLEWEMFQTEVLDKIKNTFLCSITVFRESCRLWNNVGKLGRAGKATDKAHALLAGCVRLHTHTRICNTCYFSMAATVPRTCFSVIRTLPGLL